MKIRVDDITEKPRLLTFEEPYDVFPALASIHKVGQSEFLSPLAVELTVVREYGHIRVKGEVSVGMRFACSRCLALFDSVVRSDFTVFYTEGNHFDSDEDEVELAEEDLVSVSFEGEEIDFSHEVAEQVIMEMPLKPLCADDCRGLCSTCGADLNEADCGCESASFNLKFNALKNFKVEK